MLLTVTYTVESGPGLVGGGEIGVNIGMSAAIPYNIDNYMSFKLAAAVIRKALTAALADYGAFVEVSEKVEVFPSERMSLYINCRPCRSDGLPLSVSPADPLKLLEVIRPVISSIGDAEVSAGDLKAYREVLLNEYAEDLRESGKLMEKVLTRYSEGKDFVTGYKAAVNAVSADSIREILRQLRSGAEVEYVII